MSMRTCLSCTLACRKFSASGSCNVFSWWWALLPAILPFCERVDLSLYFFFFLSVRRLAGNWFILFRGFGSIYLKTQCVVRYLLTVSWNLTTAASSFWFWAEVRRDGREIGARGRSAFWSMVLLPVSLSLRKKLILELLDFLASIFFILFLELSWSLIVVTCL